MNIAILVKEYVVNCKEREPIFVMDVEVPKEHTNARDIAFHRLEKENIIKSYEKGIYYKPKMTMFGEVGIDLNKLIEKKYIKKNNKINGYVTGPALWNAWNLTTQVPNNTWVTTNFVSRTTEKENLKVKLIKPKTTVDDYNFKLLQWLDVVEQYNKIQDIRTDIFYEVLREKIAQLNKDEMQRLIKLTNGYNKLVKCLTGAIIENIILDNNQIDYFYDDLTNLKNQVNRGKKCRKLKNLELSNLDEWGFIK